MTAKPHARPDQHNRPNDRLTEMLAESLTGDFQIEEIDVCLHTPDQFKHIDLIDEGEHIRKECTCQCGKKVTEHFSIFKTDIS